MAVAQRSLRKLCNHCKQQVSDEEQPGIPRSLFKMPLMYYKQVGCPECNFTGYSGRIAVFEIIEVCEELRLAIKAGKTEINEYLKSRQISKLSSSAYDLFCRGESSFDEVLPLLMSDF